MGHLSGILQPFIGDSYDIIQWYLPLVRSHNAELTHTTWSTVGFFLDGFWKQQTQLGGLTARWLRQLRCSSGGFPLEISGVTVNHWWLLRGGPEILSASWCIIDESRDVHVFHHTEDIRTHSIPSNIPWVFFCYPSETEYQHHHHHHHHLHSNHIYIYILCLIIYIYIYDTIYDSIYHL